LVMKMWVADWWKGVEEGTSSGYLFFSVVEYKLQKVRSQRVETFGREENSL